MEANMQHTDRQALEEKIAHLEHAVSELSDVIRRQDRDLAALTRRVEILAATEPSGRARAAAASCWATNARRIGETVQSSRIDSATM